MMPHTRSIWLFAPLAALTAAAACDSGTSGADPYLSPGLRAAVDELKSDVAATPTDESTIAARARVLADWADAYSVAGGEVGLDGPRVRLQSTLPPSGQGAINQGQNLDRLVREFTLRDEEGALGELTAESLGPFEARTYVTLRQTWTAGTRPVGMGGGFWVAKHFQLNFSALQTDDPTLDGYVTIETSDADAAFEPWAYMASGPHGGFRGAAPAVAFRLIGGTLDPGEAVTITYGDTSGGGRGLLLPSTSGERMPLPLYVDLDGSGEWRPLPLQPFVITGTEVAGVHAFAPSIVEPGETFTLSVRAEDRYFNRATGPIPAFDVLVNGEVRASTPGGAEPIVLVELSLDDSGPHWVTLRSEDGSITGDANPILVVDDPERRIYWGDTHGHSGYAEGIGTVDFFMRFAREDARLDFVTHSEHDMWLDDGEWATMQDATRKYDAPGEFIPYLGYEWTRSRTSGGHHNVLFRNVENYDRVSGLEYPFLSQLYQGLQERYDPADVLTIPHAHQPGDFRQSNPALEPLIEVMSMHGTFEWFARSYLSRGHQVGFVAASDDHLSHPGYSAPNRNTLSQRGGLGAVLAPERSRDALFDAMKARQTYATTGDRIILDVELNGVGMGQRAPSAGTRTVTGRVIGTAPIESITLFKNDRAIWWEDYLTDETASASESMELLLSFHSDATPLQPDAPRGWRHWRGMMTVEGAELEAIEATDFINPGTQFLEPEGNGARFATHTRGDWSSLRLTLSNVQPGAAIVLDLEEALETGSGPPSVRRHVDIPGQRVRLGLADMRRGQLERLLPADGYPEDGVTLRRIIRDGERDVEFSYTDEREPGEGDYYYVRVRQVNDAMAWSSPVWVGGYASR